MKFRLSGRCGRTGKSSGKHFGEFLTSVHPELLLLRWSPVSLDGNMWPKRRDILVAFTSGPWCNEMCFIESRLLLKWPGVPHSKQTMAFVFVPWALGLLLLRLVVVVGIAVVVVCSRRSASLLSWPGGHVSAS
ncbi:hypothetical protein Tco_0877599 [Tanacetum coccineum]|uniref:Uncharacterized protein n=1 Tax=Tanacetum coccineum TaxID=301880 RepID=A0ABQ5BX10_9ASTR